MPHFAIYHKIEGHVASKKARVPKSLHGKNYAHVISYHHDPEVTISKLYVTDLGRANIKAIHSDQRREILRTLKRYAEEDLRSFGA